MKKILKAIKLSYSEIKMKFKEWARNDWDIILGGIIPLASFAIIWLLTMLGYLSGWVGLGVFAFTAWIAMLLALIGLISSIWRGYGVLDVRNLWFIPGLAVFAFTIGANILEEIFNR